MVRIQLETGYLDVSEKTAFPLTYSIAEIREIGKKKGVFSKSIELPGTKNNHDLLGHYYDVNISEGTFDLNAATPCIVLDGDNPVASGTVLTLVSVNKKQNTAQLDEQISYTVLIKGTEGDFFTKIDQKKLTDIYFDDLAHVFSSGNIVASWANTYADGYVYPAGITASTNYYISDFRPAIYLRTYWERIHAAAGYQWEWTNRNDFFFDQLIIPYNGDQPNQNYALNYFVEATHADDTINATGNADGTYPQTTTGTTLTNWTEVADAQGIFTPVTGEWTSPFYITPGQALGVRVTGALTIDLDNISGSSASYVNLGAQYGVKYSLRIDILVNGVYTIGSATTAGTIYPATSTLANGVTTILNAVNFDHTVPVSGIGTGDDITVRFTLLQQTSNVAGIPQNGILPWYDSATQTTPAQVNTEMVVENITAEWVLSSNTLSSGQTIYPADFVPQNIQQKDFIKAICTLFNLYVVSDVTDPNKLIYKTRDEYYDDGADLDWTLKLAKDKDQDITFLPDIVAKKLVLTYKEDKDPYNVAYKDNIKEIYGQVEYTFDSENVRGTKVETIMFSPTPMVATSFGAKVPSFVGSSPKNNIRLLIHGANQTCSPFNMYDYGITGQLNQTTIVHCSHFNHPTNPTFDLNFAICDYYFYPGIQPTINTVYNMAWRRTMGQLNSGRMLTAYFDLTAADMANFSLDAKIRIENSWWNVNKIVDYQVGNDKLTKVELISVDEEIDIPTFIRKVNIPLVLNRNPWKELTTQFFDVNNVNLSSGGVIVLGVGNTVLEGVNGLVRGDNNVIERSGIWVNGRNLEDVSSEAEVTLIDDTYTASYNERTIVATAGTFDLTLPPANGFAGFKFNIQNSGVGTVTVVPDGSETISGASNVILVQWDGMRIISDGTNWVII